MFNRIKQLFDKDPERFHEKIGQIMADLHYIRVRLFDIEEQLRDLRKSKQLSERNTKGGSDSQQTRRSGVSKQPAGHVSHGRLPPVRKGRKSGTGKASS